MLGCGGGVPLTTLESKIGYTFVDRNLLEKSLTHKSFFNESDDKTVGHNEKLEFIGDAVIDLVISHKLMIEFISLEEGDLSKLRASLVNETSLAKIAVDLKLDDELKLGKGEIKSGGQQKPRLLASVVESLVGAVYFDSGFEKVKEVTLHLFAEEFTKLDDQAIFKNDYKTRLQELTQVIYRCTPDYVLVKSEGPDHHKFFVIEVVVNGTVLSRGEGYSKKQAEQDAASKALEKLV